MFRVQNRHKGNLSTIIARLFIGLLMTPFVWAEDTQPTTSDTDTPAEATAAEIKKDIKRHSPDIEKSRHALLAEQLARQSPKDEIIWLKDSAQEYLALLRREVTGTPQGGVLILHSQQSHGDWPENAGPIRQYLPDYGWTTLSIALPDPAFPKVPERSLPAAGSTTANTASTEDSADSDKQGEIDDATIADTPSGELKATSSEEPDGAEVTDEQVAQDPAIASMQTEEDQTKPVVDIQKQMIERITQGISELQKRGQLNLVIIAQDYSVFPALKFLTGEIPPSTKPTKGWALVIINHGAFEQPTPESGLENRSNGILAEDMAILNIPTLDLQYKRNQLSEQQAQVRKNSMRRNKHNSYTLVKLDRTSGSEQLQKRIRGWLKKNAAGQEIKNK